MSIPNEHAQEFTRFPAVLRELVAAELAAGNEIVKFAHGFPAAPCGAYIKLARPVTSRPRRKTPELDFFDRRGSSYSGEFTDATRHFFVLEPPHPPEPEPDMDAIRRALEPKPDPLVQLAHRRTGASADLVLGRSPAAAGRAVTLTETATGATLVVSFRDGRPPHEVQWSLEGELRTLFTAAVEEGRLRLRAKANVNGARYAFELEFVAALLLDNCYSLRTEVSWAEQPATHHDYFRKTSDAWLQMWTRELLPASPPAAGAGLDERYRALCEQALASERHLDSVAAVQRAIVEGVKRGGSYRSSHKEGGTTICWRIDRFVRSDYGEEAGSEAYADEAAFLVALHRFCHFEVTRHAGSEPLSEFEVWKLILRAMYPR